MLRAIVFDFNGVLVDDEPLHEELFRAVLAEEGLPFGHEEYRDRYLGLDDRECFVEKLAAEGRPATEGLVGRLIARKAGLYEARVRASGYPFFPGALDLVRALAASGMPLGLVSGALRREIEGALAAGGLAGLFAALVPAEDVAASKPDPEGYRRALDLLNATVPGLRPEQAVAVEDSPAGVAAARAAGLRTVGVAQTYGRERLAGCDAVVERVGELSVAALRRLCGEDG